MTPLSPLTRCVGCLVGLLMLTLSLTACGPKNFTNTNDELRRQNMQLQQKVDALQQSIDLRLAEIARLEQTTTTPPALAGAKVPMCVALRFDRYSGAFDADQNGQADTLRVYVRTLDQQGRFIPTAGRAVVQVVQIVAEQPPVVLLEVVYDPAQFDQAYRSGLMGTHYALESALTPQMRAIREPVTVKLSLTEAASGAVLTHEQAMSLQR